MKKRAEQKSIKNFEKELKEKRAKELEVRKTRILTFSVHHGCASCISISSLVVRK